MKIAPEVNQGFDSKSVFTLSYSMFGFCSYPTPGVGNCFG